MFLKPTRLLRKSVLLLPLFRLVLRSQFRAQLFRPLPNLSNLLQKPSIALEPLFLLRVSPRNSLPYQHLLQRPCWNAQLSLLSNFIFLQQSLQQPLLLFLLNHRIRLWKHSNRITANRKVSLPQLFLALFRSCLLLQTSWHHHQLAFLIIFFLRFRLPQRHQRRLPRPYLQKQQYFPVLSQFLSALINLTALQTIQQLPLPPQWQRIIILHRFKRISFPRKMYAPQRSLYQWLRPLQLRFQLHRQCK